MRQQPVTLAAPRNASRLRQRIEAEAREPVPVLRDGDGAQRLFVLAPELEQSRSGAARETTCAGWDTEVSRLQPSSSALGMSGGQRRGLARNGSFVKGGDSGRHPCGDGD